MALSLVIRENKDHELEISPDMNELLRDEIMGEPKNCGLLSRNPGQQSGNL
jgi:hypothetical protein